MDKGLSHSITTFSKSKTTFPKRKTLTFSRFFDSLNKKSFEISTLIMPIFHEYVNETLHTVSQNSNQFCVPAVFIVSPGINETIFSGRGNFVPTAKGFRCN